MKNREIKFRTWNQGTMWYAGKNAAEFYFDENPWDCEVSGQLMQFIGIKDKTGKDIYQGDIIKFKYSVGDFAWEMMEEEEVKKNMNMLGKKYVGVITPDVLCPINFGIIVGNQESTHMTFPLAYAMNSLVIGNIYENPDLLNNETP